MTALALDTSVAVPLLLRDHPDHEFVDARLRGSELALTTHSLAETYSVLTRLPAPARLALTDVVRAIDASFGAVLSASPDTLRRLHEILAEHRIAGGAVYDAVVALAARDAGARLVTRDARAIGTYQALGVDLEILAA